MNNYLKFLLMLLIVAIAVFTAHYLLLSTMDVQSLWQQSGYSLVGMYTFATVASLFVCALSLMAQWSMPKSLGFLFLGLILVKAIASYIYVKDGLGLFENKFIEYNFLTVFFVFLFFDVFVAFQALNQDQKEK